MWDWVLDALACPVCHGRLAVRARSEDGRDGMIGHADAAGCAETYPIIDGVARLLVGDARPRLARERADWFASSPFGSGFGHWLGDDAAAPDLRLVARFDREWRAFPKVGTEEQERIFARYFDVVPPELIAEGRLVLDAGCGAGRWAFEVQRRGPRVVALDLGRSIEVAERNTGATGRVACVQADVRALPIRPGAFDVVYSLGVLHHVDRTEDAVRDLALAVRPGGALLLYLYYALDSRSAGYRALFALSDAVRRVASVLPQAVLVALTTAIAAAVYLPLARIARRLRAIGLRRLAAALPLSFYADLSFATMRNDSLDRFGTRLEKRFTRTEIRELLERSGLRDIVVSDGPPYWHAVGRAPAR